MYKELSMGNAETSKSPSHTDVFFQFCSMSLKSVRDLKHFHILPYGPDGPPAGGRPQ